MFRFFFGLLFRFYQRFDFGGLLYFPVHFAYVAGGEIGVDPLRKYMGDYALKIFFLCYNRIWGYIYDVFQPKESDSGVKMTQKNRDPGTAGPRTRIFGIF